MGLKSDGSSMIQMGSLVTDLDKTNQREAYLETVCKIFDMFGLGHACIAASKTASQSLIPLWRVIPNSVGAACSNLTNNGRHPAIELAKHRYFPFDLFEFRKQFSDDYEVDALFTAFENSRIFHVYGLPIHSHNGDLFVFVVGRASEEICMPELLSLQAICSNAVNHILTLERRPSETKKLDKTQTQLLILVSKGNSLSDVALALDLSEVSIEIMKQVIIDKLGASNFAHAMVTALIEGEMALTDCLT